MSKSKTMSWNDRFALIDHYKPNDDNVCSVFGVTIDELSTARNMRAAGTFRPTPNLDFKSYSRLFPTSGTITSTVSAATVAKDTKNDSPGIRRRGGGVTSITKTKPQESKPRSAQKLVSPVKRGRKGNNISKAFAAIPHTPTELSKYASNHTVSVAVLRQAKRFDNKTELGHVRVKMNKKTKQLMIWREKPDN